MHCHYTHLHAPLTLVTCHDYYHYYNDVHTIIIVKYTYLESTHYFIPVAIETLGAMGQEGRSFFKEVARRIVATTNEPQTCIVDMFDYSD